jgi:hypothetical protein
MVGEPVGETGEGEVVVGEGTGAGEGKVLDREWKWREKLQGKKKTMLQDMADILLLLSENQNCYVYMCNEEKKRNNCLFIFIALKIICSNTFFFYI